MISFDKEYPEIISQPILMSAIRTNPITRNLFEIMKVRERRYEESFKQAIEKIRIKIESNICEDCQEPLESGVAEDGFWCNTCVNPKCRWDNWDNALLEELGLGD